MEYYSKTEEEDRIHTGRNEDDDVANTHLLEDHLLFYHLLFWIICYFGSFAILDHLLYLICYICLICYFSFAIFVSFAMDWLISYGLDHLLFWIICYFSLFLLVLLALIARNRVKTNFGNWPMTTHNLAVRLPIL
uniref:Uncharacterized protein n=1 Tax=Caenorhabditis japonica TaxID=281687 RepID=A0A8R1E5I4_CAEJA